MHAKTDAARPSAPASRPHYSDGYKRLVLSLLVAAYTFNFIDRTIIATIGQAIKVDLKISDTQLGLLGGLYFALLYTLLGVPIARLAERFSRVNIIATAVVIWSGFTALCGTAGNFATLAAFRFGVGVGEAGLSPPAHSLISDYFEPKRRASALAVYAFGIPLGTMLGAVMGGYLAQNFSWRVAFYVVGFPGVLMALAIKLFIKEPPRGHSEPVATPVLVEDLSPDEPAKPAPTLMGELSEMWAVFKVLFGVKPVFHMVMGITLVSFGGYGGGQFAPPYFIRAFGLDLATVGLIVGLVAGFSQGVGTLAGGFITDRLAKLSPRWYSLVPAIGVTLAYPCHIAVYNATSWPVAAAFLLLPGVLAYVYLGPTFGVVQNMFETRRRATAAAVMLLFVNLIALGGGPPFAGWAIDQFAAFHLAHPGMDSIWTSFAHLFGQAPGAFQAACPGGAAPKGSAPEAMAACKGALVLATRHGVLLAYAVGLWGALHYLLGSFGLAEALAKARADRGES
jgi:MFS family permease